MNCPLCGEVCRCDSEPISPALGRWEPDAGDAAGPERSLPLRSEAIADDGSAPEESAGDPEARADAISEGGNDAWRDELSARLNRYRARRKMRPPRYPSLKLQFDAVESVGSADAVRTPPVYEPVSDHALALDGMRQAPPATSMDTDVQLRQEAAAPTALHESNTATGHSSSGHTAKILEFPRFAWGPPPPPPDQLAEPVSDRPRILEAPEVVPPAPALGGITIEAAESQEAEKRPGIDIPLQSASLGRRVLASGIDGLIVVLAAALFGFIFWKVAAVRPPLVQILGLGAGIPCLFWAVYQYLLIVYAGSTPGLRAAKLELARFDGTSTNRRLRRWRVLAACLSGVSLGMGYAWVFLDEDVLCWHDRITHTYLAPRKGQSKGGLAKT